MEKLAIHGGPKVRTRPFSKRRPFGGREEELLTQVTVFSVQFPVVRGQ